MESVQIEENSALITKRSERKMGVELLRIVSIFLIICVHLLNASGFKANSKSLLETRLLGFLDTIFATSVNIFVLISGFFSVKGKFKPKKLLNLWLVVVFYELLSFFGNLLIEVSSFNFIGLIKCFFPLFSNSYWFFSMYFILYLCSPFLNKILSNSSFVELLFLVVGIFLLVIFCGVSDLDKNIKLEWGYNLFWFICLYIISGFLRLHTPKLKLIFWILLYLLFTMLNYLSFFSSGIFSILRLGAETCEQYTSFWVLCSSVSMFMIFYNINFKSKFIRKTISLISSTVFSIYLFDVRGIRSYLHFTVLKVQRFYGQVNSVFYVLIFAVVIFLIGFIIDLLRQLLAKGIAMLTKKLKKKVTSK